MARLISFRFDDGFIDGAETAAAILHPDKVSFFIVTRLVEKTLDLGKQPLFAGRNFGNWDVWRSYVERGHDVQPHGMTHTRFSELSIAQRHWEIQNSLVSIRRLHHGPYIFCFPYNDIVPIDLAAYGFAAGGFQTQSSDVAPNPNRLANDFDLYHLKSWAVRERHLDQVVHQLDNIPEWSWTILAFHSLNGEGHEPWTAMTFERLVQAVRAKNFCIMTVAAIITALRNGMIKSQ